MSRIAEVTQSIYYERAEFKVRTCHSRPGDIYTHLYSGVGSNILTADGKNVDSSVKR